MPTSFTVISSTTSPNPYTSRSMRSQPAARSFCENTGTTSVAGTPKRRHSANASRHTRRGWRRKYWLQKVEPT